MQEHATSQKCGDIFGDLRTSLVHCYRLAKLFFINFVLIFALEFLDYGSLSSLLSNQTVAMPMSLKLNIIKDIAAGMLHLQLEKIVHKGL
jgi:hypothetical protein